MAECPAGIPELLFNIPQIMVPLKEHLQTFMPPISESTFLLNLQENMYLHHFKNACFVTAVERLGSASIGLPNTFMESEQRYMPHWTPSQQDNIVYTTIEEASKQDIELDKKATRALAASATHCVKDRIVRALQMAPVKTIMRSANRPNIGYSVERVRSDVFVTFKWQTSKRSEPPSLR